jgi:hypothetical protein
MGSRSRETHCWEVSQCENTQQRGLSTCAVTNNHQFPVSESADVCEGTPLACCCAARMQNGYRISPRQLQPNRLACATGRAQEHPNCLRICCQKPSNSNVNQSRREMHPLVDVPSHHILCLLLGGHGRRLGGVTFSFRGAISKKLSKACTSEGKGEEKRGSGRVLSYGRQKMSVVDTSLAITANARSDKPLMER